MGHSHDAVGRLVAKDAHALATARPYSYRDDESVPRFPDDRPLIVFDGVCVLCSGFARFVARHDTTRQFRFATAQSPLGAALFRHYGLDAVNYETNLLVAEGRVCGKLDAFAGIMTRLGGLRRAAAIVRLLPTPLGERLYDAIAQNRYALFGRTQTCAVPDASWRDRVIG